MDKFSLFYLVCLIFLSRVRFIVGKTSLVSSPKKSTIKPWSFGTAVGFSMKTNIRMTFVWAFYVIDKDRREVVY